MRYNPQSIQKARVQAEAIAAIDPYFGALAHASVCAEEGESERATALYRKAIRILPGGWQAYKRFGSFCVGVRRLDEAIALFKKYVEVAPNSADSYIHLGRAHEQKRQYDEAIRAFHKAFEINPALVHLLFRVAQLYEFKGSRDEAIKFYQKYLGFVSTARAAEDARTEIRELSG